MHWGYCQKNVTSQSSVNIQFVYTMRHMKKIKNNIFVKNKM